MTCAALALLVNPQLTLEVTAAAQRPTDIPSVSGLLSFREAPALLEALSHLPRPPDLLLVDGQGLACAPRFRLPEPIRQADRLSRTAFPDLR